MGRKKTSGFSFLFYNKDGDGLGWRVGSCLPTTLMTWAVGQRSGMVARRPCFTISPFLFSFTLFCFSRHLPLAGAETSNRALVICSLVGNTHAITLITAALSQRVCTVGGAIIRRTHLA
jgi:hypothetical protein